jgi:hypothetical protein
MVNKKMVSGMLAVVLTFSMFIAGCATRVGDFTLMSSKNVDLSAIGSYQRSAKNVKGSDTKLSMILFIPLNPTYDLKKALDKALSKIPGAEVIVDVRIDVRKIPLLLVTFEGYVVSGTVLINPQVVDASETTADKPYLVMDTKDGKHFTKRYVNETEYQYLLAGNNSTSVVSTDKLQGDV